MTQTVTLTGVSTKTGSNDSGGWTLYMFEAAGGSKYQTFDDNVGDTAAKLLNQPVEVEYEHEQRGKYTNNILKAVKPASGSGTAAPTPGETLIAVVNAQDDRELRIMRQSGLERAILTVNAGITTVDGVSDLFALADHYISYFQNGVESEVKF